jgi:hypothetical protein
MPRKKKDPKTVPAPATPRWSRNFVSELGHIIKEYGIDNKVPEIEALAHKLIWFMRFEDSFENYAINTDAALHPTFEEFFAALLAQPNFETLCGDEAAFILKREYPPKASPRMPNGFSTWSHFERKPYPPDVIYL